VRNSFAFWPVSFLRRSRSHLPSCLGKALGLIFGHSVYAVATVLAVFMAGLAAGSAYIDRWSAQRTESLTLYSWIEFLVAATGAFSLAGLAGVSSLYVAAYPSVNGLQPLLLALRFFGAAVVLFIPTFLMGGTLPVLVRGITGILPNWVCESVSFIASIRWARLPGH